MSSNLFHHHMSQSISSSSCTDAENPVLTIWIEKINIIKSTFNDKAKEIERLSFCHCDHSGVPLMKKKVSLPVTCFNAAAYSVVHSLCSDSRHCTAIGGVWEAIQQKDYLSKGNDDEEPLSYPLVFYSSSTCFLLERLPSLFYEWSIGVICRAGLYYIDSTWAVIYDENTHNEKQITAQGELTWTNLVSLCLQFKYMSRVIASQFLYINHNTDNIVSSLFRKIFRMVIRNDRNEMLICNALKQQLSVIFEQQCVHADCANFVVTVLEDLSLFGVLLSFNGQVDAKISELANSLVKNSFATTTVNTNQSNSTCMCSSTATLSDHNQLTVDHLISLQYSIHRAEDVLNKVLICNNEKLSSISRKAIILARLYQTVASSEMVIQAISDVAVAAWLEAMEVGILPIAEDNDASQIHTSDYCNDILPGMESSIGLQGQEQQSRSLLVVIASLCTMHEALFSLFHTSVFKAISERLMKVVERLHESIKGDTLGNEEKDFFIIYNPAVTDISQNPSGSLVNHLGEKESISLYEQMSLSLANVLVIVSQLNLHNNWALPTLRASINKAFLAFCHKNERLCIEALAQGLLRIGGGYSMYYSSELEDRRGTRARARWTNFTNEEVVTNHNNDTIPDEIGSKGYMQPLFRNTRECDQSLRLFTQLLLYISPRDVIVDRFSFLIASDALTFCENLTSSESLTGIFNGGVPSVSAAESSTLTYYLSFLQSLAPKFYMTLFTIPIALVNDLQTCQIVTCDVDLALPFPCTLRCLCIARWKPLCIGSGGYQVSSDQLSGQGFPSWYLPYDSPNATRTRSFGYLGKRLAHAAGVLNKADSRKLTWILHAGTVVLDCHYTNRDVNVTFETTPFVALLLGTIEDCLINMTPSSSSSAKKVTLEEVLNVIPLSLPIELIVAILMRLDNIGILTVEIEEKFINQPETQKSTDDPSTSSTIATNFRISIPIDYRGKQRKVRLLVSTRDLAVASEVSYQKYKKEQQQINRKKHHKGKFPSANVSLKQGPRSPGLIGLPTGFATSLYEGLFPTSSSDPCVKLTSERGGESVSDGRNGWRMRTVETIIVRIAKRKSSVMHDDLISDTLSETRHFARISISTIQICIDSLIEKQFLRRDENDDNIYHYVA